MGPIETIYNLHAVEPDDLLAEILELDHQDTLYCFHHTLASGGTVRSSRPIPNITINVKRNNYRGNFRVAHAGKGWVKTIDFHYSNSCEDRGIFPEEQCGSRHARLTVDMLFVLEWLHGIGRYEDILRICRKHTILSINSCCGSHSHALASNKDAYNHPPVPRRIRACVRTDDGEHSEWFDVTWTRRQGGVLSPLKLNVLFAGVILVVLGRFSKAEGLGRALVYFKEDVVVGKEVPMTCV